MHKRSIGFSTLVHVNEHTLFNVEDMGIVEAGVRAAKIDLDIPPPPANFREPEKAILHRFVWVTQPFSASVLLAVIAYACPKWFEPVRRRLALNDLQWIDADRGFNDIDDFDPWSKIVLQTHRDFISIFGTKLA
jgi:hypothetical protein